MDRRTFLGALASGLLAAPLAAGEVDEDDVDVEEVEVEPTPTYTPPPPEPTYSPPPRPARYRCGRCGKTMGTETETESRRMHSAERRDYPGCPPTTRARNAQCQADALPNGFTR